MCLVFVNQDPGTEYTLLKTRPWWIYFCKEHVLYFFLPLLQSPEHASLFQVENCRVNEGFVGRFQAHRDAKTLEKTTYSYP